MSVTKSVGCIKDALNGQWFPYFLRFAAKQTTSQAQTALEEVGVGTARTLGSKTQRRIHSPAQPSIIDHYRASIILTTWPRRKTGQILMTFFLGLHSINKSLGSFGYPSTLFQWYCYTCICDSVKWIPQLLPMIRKNWMVHAVLFFNVHWFFRILYILLVSLHGYPTDGARRQLQRLSLAGGGLWHDDCCWDIYLI